MSKNWERENMMTLAANVRKEDAEAFAKIAKENNTTVGGMLRMFIRDSYAAVSRAVSHVRFDLEKSAMLSENWKAELEEKVRRAEGK